MNKWKLLIIELILLEGIALILPSVLNARIKMVALPERGKTLIRLDNPEATLIEEERILTLQRGVNKVDFSWKGVNIDVDSIRLLILTNRDKVTLLSVSYPPNEAALVWDINSADACEVTVRISYLLSFIDRVISYKGVTDKEESRMDLKCLLVLRNFSGEDFQNASVYLDEGQSFDQAIGHEETKQLPFFNKQDIPIEKVWTFDARTLPWDPEKVETNVGIPVTYQILNGKADGLGSAALWGGKVRVFQEDGHQGTIFLGEDQTGIVPVGEKMRVYIGDSRDIVVTQHKMQENRINIRRNNTKGIVLYDTDELITASIENFKDKPALLTMIQGIPGQWDMEACNMPYKRRDAYTLEFGISLPAHGKEELSMHYHRRNVR